METKYKFGDYYIHTNIGTNMKWKKLGCKQGDNGSSNIVDLRQDVLSFLSKEAKKSCPFKIGQIYCIIGNFFKYHSLYYIVMVLDESRSIVIISNAVR